MRPLTLGQVGRPRCRGYSCPLLARCRCRGRGAMHAYSTSSRRGGSHLSHSSVTDAGGMGGAPPRGCLGAGTSGGRAMFRRQQALSNQQARPLSLRPCAPLRDRRGAFMAACQIFLDAPLPLFFPSLPRTISPSLVAPTASSLPGQWSAKAAEDGSVRAG